MTINFKDDGKGRPNSVWAKSKVRGGTGPQGLHCWTFKLSGLGVNEQEARVNLLIAAMELRDCLNHQINLAMAEDSKPKSRKTLKKVK
jgi:hypothetical protein